MAAYWRTASYPMPFPFFSCYLSCHLHESCKNDNCLFHENKAFLNSIQFNTYLSNIACEWPDSTCCRTALATTFLRCGGHVCRRSSLRARGLGIHVCGLTATKIGPMSV